MHINELGIKTMLTLYTQHTSLNEVVPLRKEFQEFLRIGEVRMKMPTQESKSCISAADSPLQNKKKKLKKKEARKVQGRTASNLE